MVAWWVDQIINTSFPLQEKITLFWHGHFATSFRKVRVPYMMYLQNKMFRGNALGNWQKLITDVSQDPAMLVYLDNTTSRANAPNENYARELMALFTLGEGHYSEDDIKAAARAFTGWDGGYAWITTSTLTQRYNLAKDLVNLRSREQRGSMMQRRRMSSAAYRLKTQDVLPPEKRGARKWLGIIS